MDRKLIKEESKDALVGKRLMILLIIIIVSAISGALAYVGIGFLVAPVLSAGMFVIVKEMFVGKEIDFNRLFVFFKDLNHAVKIVGVSLLTAIIVLLGTLLFIIPGVIFGLQYSQAMFIITENPDMGIWEAMQKSKQLMDGHKIDFLVFILSFIGHFILVGITFGLYALYLAPYIQTAYVNYYLHLTNQKQSLIINAELDL